MVSSTSHPPSLLPTKNLSPSMEHPPSRSLLDADALSFATSRLLHTLNNHLNCIVGALDLIDPQDPVFSPTQQTGLHLIQRATQAILGISGQIGGLWRREPPQPQPLALADLLQTATTKAREILPASFALLLPKILPDASLFVDARFLTQALLHLFAYACDEVGGQGALHLSLAPQELESWKHYPLGSFVLQSGKGITIALETSHPTLWEQFFTHLAWEEGCERELQPGILACAAIIRQCQGALLPPSTAEINHPSEASPKSLLLYLPLA